MPVDPGSIDPKTVGEDTARELLGLDKVNLVDHVAIQVASPETIRSSQSARKSSSCARSAAS